MPHGKCRPTKIVRKQHGGGEKDHGQGASFSDGMGVRRRASRAWLKVPMAMTMATPEGTNIKGIAVSGTPEKEIRASGRMPKNLARKHEPHERRQRSWPLSRVHEDDAGRHQAACQQQNQSGQVTTGQSFLNRTNHGCDRRVHVPGLS